MPEDVEVYEEVRRRTEIPRRGNKLCEILDRSPILQARQSGDHRTYRNTLNGEIITILNKKRDLKDANPKVFSRWPKY